MNTNEVDKDTTTPWFAVRDAKVGRFAQPFASMNNETAVRAFTVEANNPDSNIHQFAEDYSLWLVGYFDSDRGVVVKTLTSEPEHLVRAVDVKRVPQFSDDAAERLEELEAAVMSLLNEENEK